MHSRKTSISLQWKKIFQKEKCHSSLFWRAFQVSRNYFHAIYTLTILSSIHLALLRVCLKYRYLTVNSRKAAPTNDGHLEYTDTLRLYILERWYNYSIYGPCVSRMFIKRNTQAYLCQSAPGQKPLPHKEPNSLYLHKEKYKRLIRFIMSMWLWHCR